MYRLEIYNLCSNSTLLFQGKSKPYPSEKEKVEQDEMKSRIDELTTLLEEIKNTPKAVIAFRATCAKNFPSGYTTSKSEYPGKSILTHHQTRNLIYIIKTIF